MTYIRHNVNISEGQKQKIQNAVKNKTPVSIRLSKNDLNGDHMLLLTPSQINKIVKAKSLNEGVTLNMSLKQLKENLTVEGGFIGALLGMLAPLAARVLPTLLGGLATGLISGGVEKAIGGKGLDKKEKDGFFIQKDNKCYCGEYSGDGLYLRPHKYQPKLGDGIFLKSGGNIYEGSSILNQIPIIGSLFKLFGL